MKEEYLISLARHLLAILETNPWILCFTKPMMGNSWRWISCGSSTLWRVRPISDPS
jgi:hypothetical protein